MADSAVPCAVLALALLHGQGCARCASTRDPAGRPVVLASDENLPRGIAVDSTAVYWTSGTRERRRRSTLYIPRDSANVYWTGGAGASSSGMVRKVSSRGGSPTTLARGQSSPRGIAVDATSVYWTNGGTRGSDGSVMRMPLGGGAPTALASRQASPRTIAVDATSVYWTNQGAGRSGGSVMKIDKGGGRLVVLASGRSSPQAIAVDATSVYWTEVDVGYDGDVAIEGQLMRVAKRGGPPVVLASGRGWPQGLAVDASGVYWTEEQDAHSHHGTRAPEGAVMRVDRSGGAPVVLATLYRRPSAIGVDARNVYWLSEHYAHCRATDTRAFDGAVVRVAKGGGPPVILASGLQRPNAIVVSATGVYWTDMGIGLGFGMALPTFEGTVSTIAE